MKGGYPKSSILSTIHPYLTPRVFLPLPTMPPRRIILADADEPSSRPKRTAAAEGLDTSLILSEPRAKRGRVDEFAASGRPTEKTEEVWEDPGEVLEKGRQLLSIVKNATEGEGERLVVLFFSLFVQQMGWIEHRFLWTS